MLLEEIRKLHEEGQLDQAKAEYLNLLETNQQNTEALHYLALLYAETGDAENAEATLKKAIAIKPEDLTLRLHLANIYKAQKIYEKAITELTAIIKLNSDYAAAYNNLGTIYDAMKNWTQAIKSYQTAIDVQPEYADAYYNLGLAQVKSGRILEAINTYQSLLEISPNHPGGLFQLGRLYMQQNQYEKAIEQFYKVLELYSFHFETEFNLATSFLRSGYLDKAKEHYLKALKIKPDDIQSLFNLGVIAMQQSKITEAIEYYQRVLSIDADNFDAHNNLGAAYLYTKDREAALKHFQKVLQMQPENKALQHTINILGHNKDLTSSPPEYIQSLFNAYADHYDTHIVNTLKYDVPQKLFAMVNEYVDVLHAGWHILDLGCGTGLCGEIFKGNNTLDGVDLAEKMLDFAAKKNIYQKLVQDDILDFLKDQHDIYNLIIAGDVIVYYGELADVFSACYRALRSQGLFVFNAEMDNSKNFELSESGRFVHGKAYLDRIAKENHFEILDYQTVDLRKQNETIVQGHLYLLKKM
jgi:predicted TPR repeat methyltransferase